MPYVEFPDNSMPNKNLQYIAQKADKRGLYRRIYVQTKYDKTLRPSFFMFTWVRVNLYKYT